MPAGTMKVATLARYQAAGLPPSTLRKSPPNRLTIDLQNRFAEPMRVQQASVQSSAAKRIEVHRQATNRARAMPCSARTRLAAAPACTTRIPGPKYHCRAIAHQATHNVATNRSQSDRQTSRQSETTHAISCPLAGARHGVAAGVGRTRPKRRQTRRLASQADSHHRRLPARWPDRCVCPHVCRAAHRQAGAVGGGGKQARRRRHHRHRSGGEGAARRLHPADDHLGYGLAKSRAVHQAALQPGPRSDADRPVSFRAAGGGGV